MINQSKHISVTFFMILFIVSLTGCRKNPDTIQTEVYSLAEIESIEIKTNANDIMFRTTESDDLTITFTGGGKSLATLENGLIIVNLHKTFAGITTEKLNTLYIDVPKNGLPAAHIETDAGNATLDNVNITNLSVNTEVGNINISGLTGNINAVSAVGSIETDLPYSTEIVSGTDGLGKTLVTNSGDTDNEQHNSVLYTNTGIITLK